MGIVVTVRRPHVATVALAVILAACTGGGEPAGTFSVPPDASAPAAARTGPSAAPATKAPPPARMFAGTASAEGSLERYCEADACTSARARPATELTAPSSGFVVFTVHRAPRTARLLVLARGEDSPARSDLNPGTMMLYPIGLPPGSYDLTLFVAWADAEASWRFGLRVSS